MHYPNTTSMIMIGKHMLPETNSKFVPENRQTLINFASKGKAIVFQTSIFRCTLLVSGRVIKLIRAYLFKIATKFSCQEYLHHNVSVRKWNNISGPWISLKFHREFPSGFPPPFGDPILRAELECSDLRFIDHAKIIKHAV